VATKIGGIKMPTSEISVPHRLSREEALGRIKKLCSEAKKKHGGEISDLREEWSGYQGKISFSVNRRVKGINISGKLSGTLTVNPSEVKLFVDYPMAAMPLKGKAENMLRDIAKDLLA